ncbi:hypothetical protein PHMEG_00028981 [Phytophthora megakarya]|uniref:Uncharacterized protein n=1 Tax=Phytophthora megakarya TaxID=4795 RepID=A0A225V3S3_9STRA|nr:hypothetical protein PHMEG_00028981 [Phytophthora megakarya]
MLVIKSNTHSNSSKKCRSISAAAKLTILVKAQSGSRQNRVEKTCCYLVENHRSLGVVANLLLCKVTASQNLQVRNVVEAIKALQMRTETLTNASVPTRCVAMELRLYLTQVRQSHYEMLRSMEI